MTLILAIILILVLFGGGGFYGYGSLGPAYGSGIGLIGVVLIVLLLAGALRL